MPQNPGDMVGDAVRSTTENIKKAFSGGEMAKKAKAAASSISDSISAALNHGAAAAHGTTHAEANSHHDAIAKARRP